MNVRIVLPAIVLATAMIFFAYDIVIDVLNNRDGYLHISIELIVFIAITLVLFSELKHVSRLIKEVMVEKSKTARLAGELLTVMHGQFERWGLSSSETEVAILLIKGLSMKEIASVRDVKEKTVRHQATSIYAKSGFSGRHELAAHFIEDLMSQA